MYSFYYQYTFKISTSKSAALYFFTWNHNDVIKWKHFLRHCPFVRGIHWSPVNSPHKGQWRGVLMFSLICARMNGWVNNHEAGDLRRHRAHYNVTVLTDWGLDKMVDILWSRFSNTISLINDCVLIQMLLKLAPRVSADSKPELVRIMAWCRAGDKPLHEPPMTHIPTVC